MVLGDKAAKIEHGAFDVGHAGQVSRIHGLEKIGVEVVVVAGKILVLRVTVGGHEVDVRAILRWLEGICTEVLVISDKVKGIGGEKLALFLQLLATDGRDEARINAAGEEGADWNIREHLHSDAVRH